MISMQLELNVSTQLYKKTVQLWVLLGSGILPTRASSLVGGVGRTTNYCIAIREHAAQSSNCFINCVLYGSLVSHISSTT